MGKNVEKLLQDLALAVIEMQDLEQRHTRMLKDHAMLMTEHSQMMLEHDRTLAKHDRILAEHDRMLAENDRLSQQAAEFRARTEQNLLEITDKLNGLISYVDKLPRQPPE